MLGFKLLNCNIYLYIIGIVTSDTFVEYNLACFQFFDYIETS